MNIGLSILLSAAALAVLAFAWFRLSHDPVGKKRRERRVRGGLQGRADDWLYFQARIVKPPMTRLYEPAPRPDDPPWLRALQSVIRIESLQGGTDLQTAYTRLLAKHRSPLANAFLRGRPRRAIRACLRRRYRGPAAVFFVWLYVIAYPRYGRRHLYLDAMSAALKELQTA